MTFATGTRIGNYEVVSLLGKGGMGEVYRAKDTRLPREVALKVSAEQFGERFRLEAQTIASLNHPNICTLFDVGPNYLVMELVEGETLAEQIKKGPLPEDDALAMARQIGDALEAAHEKSIVHRDLKPANIKITPDGRLKVLDFGLAKVGTRGEESPSADSPTLAMGMTEAGMIMGTAAYMPPEQAKGKPVDKRADIWAYGVVLYEMLTGTRPFDGETVSDVLAVVITKAPDLSKVPARSRRLIEACLEKDPKRRLRDIGEAWRLLETVPSAEPFRLQSGIVSRAWVYAGWISGAVVAAALAALAFVHFRETPPETPPILTSVMPPAGTTFPIENASGFPAISPDGKRIVFGAQGKDSTSRLYVRPLDAATATPLQGTEGASLPFWAPDSRWVGFGVGGKLKKIDITGGPPVTITDLSFAFRGASWSPEGVIVYALNAADGPLWRVPAAGGKSTATTKPENNGGRGDRMPWFLPDGRHFLYMDFQEPKVIRAGSLDAPGVVGKEILKASSQAIYSEGRLLFVREGTLLSQPFDLTGLSVTGEPVPLAEQIPILMNPPLIAPFSAAHGLLVYFPGTLPERHMVWKDRSGKELGPVANISGQLAGDVELSPDGKKLAYAVGDRAGPVNLWIYDLARELPTRFTSSLVSDQSPVWSPDGATLIWSANATQLMRKAADGSSPEKLFMSEPNGLISTSWSPDGRTLLYFGLCKDCQIPITRIWALSTGSEDNKPEPRQVFESKANEMLARFSPDGRWIAYVSNESRSTEVYVAPYARPGGRSQISLGGAAYPRWRSDGGEIFYLTRAGQLKATQVTLGKDSIAVGKTQALFEGLVLNARWPYDVTHDGQKFVVVQQAAGTSTAPLTLIQNWARRLP